MGNPIKVVKVSRKHTAVGPMTACCRHKRPPFVEPFARSQMEDEMRHNVCEITPIDGAMRNRNYRGEGVRETNTYIRALVHIQK